MCGRYALYDLQMLGREYRIPKGDAIRPNYNVAPTQTMPVATERGLALMRWGLVPRWAKDEKIGYRLISARSESVFEKPIWKAIIMRKKCLVPANGFYEWQRRAGGKQPFYIHPKDQELFMFAGVWESWHHEGAWVDTYSILTTTPNREMKDIHDRMPVILHKEDWAQWLEADRREDIEPLLVPYEDSALECFEVSKDADVVKVNNDTLILPANSK